MGLIYHLIEPDTTRQRQTPIWQCQVRWKYPQNCSPTWQCSIAISPKHNITCGIIILVAVLINTSQSHVLKGFCLGPASAQSCVGGVFMQHSWKQNLAWCRQTPAWSWLQLRWVKGSVPWGHVQAKDSTRLSVLGYNWYQSLKLLGQGWMGLKKMLFPLHPSRISSKMCQWSYKSTTTFYFHHQSNKVIV